MFINIKKDVVSVPSASCRYAKRLSSVKAELLISGHKGYLACAVPNLDREAIDVLLSPDQDGVIILALDDDWWALDLTSPVHSIDSV